MGYTYDSWDKILKALEYTSWWHFERDSKFRLSINRPKRVSWKTALKLYNRLRQRWCKLYNDVEHHPDFNAPPIHLEDVFRVCGYDISD